MKIFFCAVAACDKVARKFWPDRMRGNAISLPAFLILIFFFLSLILPHGVGFQHPFGMPNIDLPRIMVLSLNLSSLLLFIKFRKQLACFIEPAPLVQWQLIFIGIWQFIAAAFSSSPRGALLWAFGNWLTLWGLAFAIIAAGQAKSYWDNLVALLKIVVLIAMVFAIFELVTQERLITYRNTWSSDVLQNSLELTRIYRLSVGPYPNNHYLVLILCALGGFVLGSQRGYLLKGGLLIAAVASTGVVAGFVAFFVMLVANLFLERRLAAVWPLFLFIALMATVAALSSTQYAFLTSGIDSSLHTSMQSGYGSAGERPAPIHPGSLVARLMNTWSVLTQTLLNPLFGFGPGAVGDIARVRTSLQSTTDLGSFFLHIAESGLPVGFALLATLGTSLVRGYRSRSPEARAAALGLTGFVIVSMSSPITYFWGLAFVLCGVIIFYSGSNIETRGGDVLAKEGNTQTVIPASLNLK